LPSTLEKVQRVTRVLMVPAMQWVIKVLMVPEVGVGGGAGMRVGWLREGCGDGVVLGMRSVNEGVIIIIIIIIINIIIIIIITLEKQGCRARNGPITT